MFMRYEWGLAVGHTYAYADSVSAIQSVLGGRDTSEGVRNGPTSAVQGCASTGSAVAPRPSPLGVGEPLVEITQGVLTEPPSSMDGTINLTADTDGERRDFEGSKHDAAVLNDEDGEDEDEMSEDGTIDTDATSLRGFSDEEEERMFSLFGGDY